MGLDIIDESDSDDAKLAINNDGSNLPINANEPPIASIAGDNVDSKHQESDKQQEVLNAVHDEAPYGYTKDGAIRRAPGRKKSTNLLGEAQRDLLSSVTPKARREQQQKTINEPAPIPVDYQALGELAANLWFNVGQMVLGEDWAPSVENKEPQAVAGAFKDYFKSKQITQIDPGLQLVIVLGAYTLQRVNKPTVKQKFTGAFEWIKSKIKFKR
jgi:hypothetical protein